jgi:hypothetical protein
VITTKESTVRRTSKDRKVVDLSYYHPHRTCSPASASARDEERRS